MKTSEIVIGRVYRHRKHGQFKYIGAGMENTITKCPFKRKHLVVIETDQNNSHMLGNVVLPPSDPSMKEFWEDFYQVSGL